VYEYARNGACVALVARTEVALRAVAKAARDLGSPDVLVVPADVTKVDDAKRAVDETLAHFGKRRYTYRERALPHAYIIIYTPSVPFYLSLDSVKLHYPATNKKKRREYHAIYASSFIFIFICPVYDTVLLGCFPSA
jgi:NAD(P)-dependent dehydrogenase (short-subunit alcohol dehydrogenase family)